MPSKERHERQAQHNYRVLTAIPPEASDWRITVMMYISLHACRAYISAERPGYAGNDLKYDSIQRILQKEMPDAQVELAADFDRLVKYSYKTRYHCLELGELNAMMKDAEKRFEAILARIQTLGVTVKDE